jgi:hypothetical protein
MPRFAELLGRRVEVVYRTGEIHLPVTAKLVADSGRSIFLEERILHRDTVKTFCWEIPYQYIVRIRECAAPAAGHASEEIAKEEAALAAAAKALGLNESPKKA